MAELAADACDAARSPRDEDPPLPFALPAPPPFRLSGKAAEMGMAAMRDSKSCGGGDEEGAMAGAAAVTAAAGGAVAASSPCAFFF